MLYNMTKRKWCRVFCFEQQMYMRSNIFIMRGYYKANTYITVLDSFTMLTLQGLIFYFHHKFFDEKMIAEKDHGFSPIKL